MEFKNINVNEKSQYVSFMSPTLKNKKGHTRQMTKSIKNISKEDIEKVLSDTDELLSNYSSHGNDFQSFVQATQGFHPKAIEWAFEKTEFMNLYDQESVIRSIENKINTLGSDGQYIYPATLLIGASGSGKTTFIKQLIGSEKTNFPATMQSNTTIGSMIAVIKNESNNLTACAKLINKSALKDRLEQAYIQIVKEILRKEKDIRDILYDNITIFDDKKVKLQYVVSKKDFDNEQLIDSVVKECSTIWIKFLNNTDDLSFKVSEKFIDNSSNEFYIALDEFIQDRIVDSDVINSILSIICEKVKKIIYDFYEYLKENKTIEFSIEIVDERKIISFNSETIIEYPKMLTLVIKYTNGDLPDEYLKQFFFESLEYLSSANESNGEKTLFPLIEHMRIQGNFIPSWKASIESENYIIIDSEGIGHDITNQSVSMQMREIMSKSNLITVMQNGSEQMQTAFAETLKTLIYNGWIDKSRFCFNRMEMFDANAHASAESKILFIKSNIKNALKQIVVSEEKEEQKIVCSREKIFEDFINDQSCYFEYLNQHFEKDANVKPFFVPFDKMDSWNQIKAMNNPDIEDIVKKDYVITFTNELFNSVENIEKYLKEVIKKKKKFSVEDLKFKNLNPKYRADIFSAKLCWINNSFLNTFFQRIDGSAWQTVKAFNVRMAGNWGNREWSCLQPESIFIDLANKSIMDYLLNPVNINEINKNHHIEFIGIVQQFVSDIISSYSNDKSVNKIAERSIYLGLLEECWKPGEEMKGTGSTYQRKKLIKDKLTTKFLVDYNKQQANFLYPEIQELVFDNPFAKALSATYR